MIVYHLIPRSVMSNHYHGSFKDTISRVRLLQASGVEYRQVTVSDDDPGRLRSHWDGAGEARFLLEYSSYPKTLAAIRQQFPSAFIAVRSHNIEPLQHLDNHGWWSQRGPIWNAYATSRLFRNDLLAKRYASEIWSINNWETENYWQRLPGPAKSRWLPYHCPDHLLTDSSKDPSQRKCIACLPTSNKNRKSWDLVTRFISLADQLASLESNEFEFVITGDLSSWQLPASPNVRYTGMLNDLNAFLQEVRCVAMLSGLGYGYKTTIGDAIANNACVLLHPKLSKRCPDAVRPGTFTVDSDRIKQPKTLIQQIQSFEGCSRIDDQLRSEGEQIMQRLLS